MNQAICRECETVATCYRRGCSPLITDNSDGSESEDRPITAADLALDALIYALVAGGTAFFVWFGWMNWPTLSALMVGA